VNDVTATTPAPAPAATPTVPTTASPADAAARLASLRSDSAWGAKLIANDAATVKEFNDLAKQACAGNDLDLMILSAPDLPDINIDGQLSPKKVAGEIGSLRESGLSDDVIRELLSDRVPTPQEIDATKRFKAMRHGDEAWVKKFLAGDYEAGREAKLMSMILMHGDAA
jgi:hypothetical protein